ncbi:uncharacterized protein LOC135814409 [Sycon ciliatum]|uniref:uncharacterized protein LOC135814409 n=1 Tax=Sycon ciliatum TaxID=27933 RepID=UPI0020ADAC7E|eukprot:scpid22926/ scgid31337/ NADPH-dependent D-xylose reductase
MESVTLSSGHSMPLVGLGCWKIEGNVAKETIRTAIKLGYRHFDCAADYGNEAEIGAALQEAIAEGDVTRKDLFITSKLWNTHHAKEHVQEAIERTLSDLRLDYVDLYLIHFPLAMKYVPVTEKYPPGAQMDENGLPQMAKVPIQETWQAMEGLVDAGLARSIGVANFNCILITDLMTYARIPPAVDQVESHPYLVQPVLRRLLSRYNIHMTAYSPFGYPSYQVLGVPFDSKNFLELDLVQEIGARYGKTPAQVALRWNVQKGCSVVPKTVTPSRLTENMSIFDFKLTDEEVSAIDALDKQVRFNNVGLPFVWNSPLFD